MNSTRGVAACLFFSVAALLAAGCTNRMAAARRALDEISNAVAAAELDAVDYAPDGLAHVNHELSDLTDVYGRKDYAAVLKRAPSVLADAKNLVSVARSKRDASQRAVTAQWNMLALYLPQWIATVQTDMDSLSKNRRMPKGIDPASAQSELADAKDGWARAQSAFAAGESAEAIATAKDVRSKIEAAAAALKLALPGTDP